MISMKRYHKIIINKKPFYREYNSINETYSLTMVTEDELAERLIDEAVDNEIVIDEFKLNEILCKILNHHDKMYVLNYIQYLERFLELPVNIVEDE